MHHWNNTTLDLMLHWLFSSVYTQSYTGIKKTFLRLYNDLASLRKYPYQMRRDTYFCTTDTLDNGCKTIFYIRGSD